jgi:GR25 family glycosyltransferase involved in LPS biosynthesis
MNEETQFDTTISNDDDPTPLPIIQVKSSCPIKVVNLERRQDRKKQTIEILAKSGFLTENYEFTLAVNGKAIRPTKELANLFDGNDFGSKRGVIGCALSHVSLWRRLVDDPDNSYYLIMEDDFTVCQDFKTKMTSLTPHFHEKDVVFLGYHMFEKERNKAKSVYNNDKKSFINVYPLNNRLYIGGTFMYSINQTGAKKLLNYIAKNGIKHGIDYIMKIIPELHSYECQPQLAFSEWNESGKAIDTDIQNSNECLNFSKID